MKKGFIFKWNSGMGAWVCNNCRIIVEEGWKNRNTPPKKCKRCENKEEEEEE